MGHIIQLYNLLKSNFFLVCRKNSEENVILPITFVSSGISSIKHFLSVSPIWKYKPFTTLTMNNERIRYELCEIGNILAIFEIQDWIDSTRHRFWHKCHKLRRLSVSSSCFFKFLSKVNVICQHLALNSVSFLIFFSLWVSVELRLLILCQNRNGLNGVINSFTPWIYWILKLFCSFYVGWLYVLKWLRWKKLPLLYPQWLLQQIVAGIWLTNLKKPSRWV